MAILLGVLVLHGYEIIQIYLPLKAKRPMAAETIRIMSSNLLASNTKYNAQIEHISNIDPDVIVFQEYSFTWDTALSDLLVHYPYAIIRPLHGSFGIAIYSKLALLETEEILVHETSTPSLNVVVDVKGIPLRIIGTHPIPPMGKKLFRERNNQLHHLANLVKQENGALVLIGDLNVTTWSYFFKRLLRDSQLNDGRRGFGVHPTWPTWFYPAGIPIDHILVSSEITVQKLESNEVDGSDHRSIWADIGIN